MQNFLSNSKALKLLGDKVIEKESNILCTEQNCSHEKNRLNVHQQALKGSAGTGF